MLSTVKKSEKTTMDISVIIPVYNTAPWLAECIESVLAVRNGPLLEIILVDDESTDNSPEIMRSYARKHSRITALFQSHGRQGKARNTGLRQATGKYVLFLDSDDRLHGNAILEFYQEAETHRADFVVGPALSFRGRKTWINEGYAAYNQKISCTSIRDFPQLLCDPSACNKLYLRLFLEKYNILFPEDVFCQDVYFSYKASLLAKRISILPHVIHDYRSRNTKKSPSVTQIFSPGCVMECAGVYQSCLDEFRPIISPQHYALLEDRTIIRFKGFFAGMRQHPDADAPFYLILRELFQRLSVRCIAEHGNAFSMPFFMIRQGCFRHAAAVLNAPENTVAIEDFLARVDHTVLEEFTATRKVERKAPSYPQGGLRHGLKNVRLFMKKALHLWGSCNTGRIALLREYCLASLLKTGIRVFRPVVRAASRKRVWLVGERKGAWGRLNILCLGCGKHLQLTLVYSKNFCNIFF